MNVWFIGLYILREIKPNKRKTKQDQYLSKPVAVLSETFFSLQNIRTAKLGLSKILRQPPYGSQLLQLLLLVSLLQVDASLSHNIASSNELILR